MWAAFAARDARFDGRFVAAVRTTRVFCRPSCTCRRPRPEHVEYFPTPDAAVGAGYRPCKRCLPELPGGQAEADRRFVERALEAMRARLDEPLTLPILARLLAASPSALGRRFRAADGRTPMRVLADLRAERAEALLKDEGLTVLEAALSAGFGSPAAFLRAFQRRTGCSPAAWREARGESARVGGLGRGRRADRHTAG
jgi:methylphosphotriester-DNA--protein-cysteine methyltransferase